MVQHCFRSVLAFINSKPQYDSSNRAMKTRLILATTSLLSFCALTSSAQPEPGALLWSYESGNSIAGSPAVGLDGTIFFANGALFAVTKMGSNKWTFPIAGGSHGGYSSPAVAADGTVH